MLVALSSNLDPTLNKGTPLYKGLGYPSNTSSADSASSLFNAFVMTLMRLIMAAAGAGAGGRQTHAQKSNVSKKRRNVAAAEMMAAITRYIYPWVSTAQ